MVTIKDIAKLAGVAQGTVSNVLNGKGNVSSEKIRLVMDAATELNYIPNERAAMLRKGLSNSFAVLLPNARTKQYLDFYSAFESYSRTHNYSVTQFFTNETNPATELEALSESRSLLVKGIACITCCPSNASDPVAYWKYSDVKNIVFVERSPADTLSFIGFDYYLAGSEMAQKALDKKYKSICLLTGSLHFSNELAFYNGFMKIISASNCMVTHIQTDPYRKFQNIIQIFNGLMPQAFFVSNYCFAESVKDICTTFSLTDTCPQIYTVSPVYTMPENDFIKYELDYRQLGVLAAKRLIQAAENKTEVDQTPVYLPPVGFRDWYANIITPRGKMPLNVITLDSPEAYTMRSLSRLYTKKTGVDVNICIFSYDEIYEIFNTMDESSDYDIIRLDVTWLSWFAEKLFRPISSIDPQIWDCSGDFLDGTIARYGKVQEQLYALPATPSLQVLYYRKDLFESPIYKRMYFEQYHTDLFPPTTFYEFNQIARFFTKAQNPSSPVEYGATVTLGSTGVASSEYLARLFSVQKHLYDDDYKIRLNSDAAVNAMYDLIKLKHYTAPQYCSWWTNTAKSFASGNYAMSINYSNYAPDFLSHFSNIVGNIGYAPIPGNNPVIGGGSLGVSKYSSRPEDALSFIKWICNEPVTSLAALLGSTSPSKDTYSNYEILANFPWMKLVKNSFSKANGNRIPPDVSIPFDERKFLGILGMAVKNSYQNIATPEDSLQKAQEQFEKYFQTDF